GSGLRLHARSAEGLAKRCSEPRPILMPSFFTYAKVTCSSCRRLSCVSLGLAMSVTYQRVCQLALAFPGVSQGRAYGGPSLHVGRKFLGRLKEDGETLVLKIDPLAR